MQGKIYIYKSAIRLFLNRVSADPAKLSNPECSVKNKIVANLDDSSLIYIRYSEFKLYNYYLADGKIMELKPDKVKYKDLVDYVERYSKKLALLEDLKQNK